MVAQTRANTKALDATADAVCCVQAPRHRLAGHDRHQ